MGDELRARALEGKPSRHSNELRQYTEELRQSLPIPPHLASLVFEECVDTSPQTTFIVDGYPQYADRLPGFHKTLERVGAEVIAICVIDVPDSVARQRLLGRARRSDNALEVSTYIDKRLSGYQDNVIPTLESLSQHYPVHVIDGTGSQQTVADGIVNVISGSSISAP